MITREFDVTAGTKEGLYSQAWDELHTLVASLSNAGFVVDATDVRPKVSNLVANEYWGYTGECVKYNTVLPRNQKIETNSHMYGIDFGEGLFPVFQKSFTYTATFKIEIEVDE